jgi:hypothetical protein
MSLFYNFYNIIVKKVKALFERFDRSKKLFLFFITFSVAKNNVFFNLFYNHYLGKGKCLNIVYLTIMVEKKSFYIITFIMAIADDFVLNDFYG